MTLFIRDMIDDVQDVDDLTRVVNLQDHRRYSEFATALTFQSLI